MPLTAERSAPPSPEHRPNDDELHRIVHGTEPDDGPDEIVYADPRGTFFTSRADREKAVRIWQEEGQLPYPDNAAENLARTEAMLRRRLTTMDEREIPNTASDQAAFTNLRIQQIEAARIAREEAETGNPAWASDATGNFQKETQPTPEQPADTKEYVGRHRRRRIHIPLHRLIRHGGYKARHAGK